MGSQQIQQPSVFTVCHALYWPEAEWGQKRGILATTSRFQLVGVANFPKDFPCGANVGLLTLAIKDAQSKQLPRPVPCLS